MFYRLKKKIRAKYREATPIQLLVAYYGIATIITFVYGDLDDQCDRSVNFSDRPSL